MEQIPLWQLCSNLKFEFDVLFCATVNDIFVMYVTAHKCVGGLKK